MRPGVERVWVVRIDGERWMALALRPAALQVLAPSVLLKAPPEAPTA